MRRVHGAAAVAALAAFGCSGVPRSSDDPPVPATGTPTPASGEQSAAAVQCAPDNGGITLPPGFCAAVFADELGRARHLSVAPNGDLFVAVSARRDQSGTVTPGAIWVLRDTTRDGRADVRQHFAEGGNTGVVVTDRHVYADVGPAIVRHPYRVGQLQPAGPPDTIVSGMPTGGHGARNFVLSGDTLYVNIGSRSNSCQERDRQPVSPGADPCTELETRAGIWVFGASRVGQRFSPEARFATGIRNAVALARNPADGALYVVQHGRDNLFQNWPALFTEEQSAETPAEEMFRVDRGDDFGWPYCYYDRRLGRRVLAPEYGGTGQEAGRCSGTEAPVAAFPAHWGPNDILFYTGQQFPERYRGGAFIAFHGSWNRDPLPQGGYNVVFVPLRDGRVAAEFEVFADGFAGATVSPRGATHRPTGLAQARDGSLYISDDARGRIWRVVYRR